MITGSSIRWLRVAIVAAAISIVAAAFVLYTVPSSEAGLPRLADESTQAELLQAAFGAEAELGLQVVLVRSPLRRCPSSAHGAGNCYSAGQLEAFRSISEELVAGLLRASDVPDAHPVVPGVALLDRTELPGPFEYPEGTGTVGAASYGVVSASGDRAVMFLHTYGSCLEFTMLKSFVRSRDRWLLVARHTSSSLASSR